LRQFAETLAPPQQVTQLDVDLTSSRSSSRLALVKLEAAAKLADESATLVKEAQGEVGRELRPAGDVREGKVHDETQGLLGGGEGPSRRAVTSPNQSAEKIEEG
jgi:hypothetical protein